MLRNVDAGALKEMAELGAWIEFCGTAMLPPHNCLTVEKELEWLNAIGTERCVLASDAGAQIYGTQPSVFRAYLQLRTTGPPLAEIKRMAWGIRDDCSTCPEGADRPAPRRRSCGSDRLSLAVAALLATLPAVGERPELKLGHCAGLDDPYHVGAVKFAELVKTHTRDAVRVLVFPAVSSAAASVR